MFNFNHIIVRIEYWFVHTLYYYVKRLKDKWRVLKLVALYVCWFYSLNFVKFGWNMGSYIFPLLASILLSLAFIKNFLLFDQERKGERKKK